MVEDVEESEIFIGTLAMEMQLRAGVRAIQSTPVFDRAGKPVGVISTHYKQRHRPDERTCGLLDLLAAQVAEIVQSANREQALRESEQRYRAVTAQAEHSQ